MEGEQSPILRVAQVLTHEFVEATRLDESVHVGELKVNPNPGLTIHLRARRSQPTRAHVRSLVRAKEENRPPPFL